MSSQGLYPFSSIHFETIIRSFWLIVPLNPLLMSDGVTVVYVHRNTFPTCQQGSRLYTKNEGFDHAAAHN